MFTKADEEKINIKKEKIFNAGLNTGDVIRKILRFILRHISMTLTILFLGVIFFVWGVIVGKNPDASKV